MSTDDTLPPLPQQDGVEFRRVAGFPRCCVGTDGSFWAWRKSRDSLRKRRPGWKKMKGSKTPRGYIIASLSDGRRRCQRPVHQLVLEAFVGPCPPGMECCHEDNNHGNNRLSNLRWDTHKANMADAVRQGVAPIGSKCGMSKLTEADVPEIMRLVAAGATYEAVGRRYGVDCSQVSRIVRGQLWAHVPRDIVIPRLRGRNQHTG